MSHDLLISYNITIQNISVCKSLQIICWIPVTVIIDQTRSRHGQAQEFVTWQEFGLFYGVRMTQGYQLDH